MAHKVLVVVMNLFFWQHCFISAYKLSILNTELTQITRKNSHCLQNLNTNTLITLRTCLPTQFRNNDSQTAIVPCSVETCWLRGNTGYCFSAGLISRAPHWPEAVRAEVSTREKEKLQELSTCSSHRGSGRVSPFGRAHVCAPPADPRRSSPGQTSAADEAGKLFTLHIKTHSSASYRWMIGAESLLTRYCISLSLFNGTFTV